jgi:4-hydroxy-tetrahydrodipicolinate synthase
MSIFKGAATALITPFKNGLIDFDKYGEFIEWQISENIDALVVAGTTGEVATLSNIEHKALMAYSVEKVNKRVPVIIGTGSNVTMHSLDLTKDAKEAGADAVLIVTPYYNKTTQLGLIKHFTYIADRVDIPIIMYNVPSRTGLHMSASTVVELSKHPNIVAIKESSGDLSYVADIASKVSDNFSIYSGNDDVIVPILSLGGKGVISVLSNVMPKQTHTMVMDYLSGDIHSALNLQLKLYDFISAIFIETNPIPIKTCLNLLGFDVGDLRMPLFEMEEKNKNILITRLKELGFEI